MPLCMYPTLCPCPNLFLGCCRNVVIATCIPNWISFATSLNIELNFIVFLVFSSFKILEGEVCFIFPPFYFSLKDFFLLLLLTQEEEF